MLKNALECRIRRTYIVSSVSLACIAGIALASWAPRVWTGWWTVCLPLVLIFWRRQNWIFLLSLTVMALCFGLWRGNVYQERLAVYDLVEGQKVTLIGKASSDAIYGRHSQLEFDLRDARVLEPIQKPLLGSLTISGYGESMVYKGDTITVTGKIRRSLGNNVARVSYAQLDVTQRHENKIDVLRREFGAGIQSALPEPAASFALGILVGQRDTMPEHIKEQLKAVGLTHIVAVSGYNLMIILRASGRVLRNKSKFQYFICSVSLVGVFLMFTGSSPSIVRASVVCGLGLVAWYYGRAFKPLVLLLFSAALTGVANPLYVWGNVGWYLSFLAFFGVLVISPLVMQRLFGNRRPNILLAVMVESFCAEIATIPYVLFIFGQFSLVGILANVLVVALLPLAMLLSLIAGIAGTCIAAVSGWFSWPATVLITYMLDVSAILSKTPHGFVDNVGFNSLMMVCSYIFVGGILAVIYRVNKRKYGIITDKIDPASPI